MHKQSLFHISKRDALPWYQAMLIRGGAIVLALIVCADKSEAWVRPIDQKDSCDIDASIVTDHMMLRATELGLGSLWICMFDPEIVRKEFALPENIVPVNILVLGYADCEPASPDRHDTARKALEETVRFC